MAFIQTMSVKAFKALQDLDGIEVISNHKTGKLFMVGVKDGIRTSGSLGAISTKISSAADLTQPVISEITDQADATQTLFVLHNQGEAVEAVFSL